jgi:hypothetical protein
MKIFKTTLLLLLASTLSACGGGSEQNSIPAQHWKEMDVRIETHPNPPLPGMSEIVVIVTGAHGRPIQDLTVSLRGKDSMQWVQAIQDGLIGVYRRAVDLGDGDSVVLQVQLRRGSDENVLLFPLTLSAR